MMVLTSLIHSFVQIYMINFKYSPWMELVGCETEKAVGLINLRTRVVSTGSAMYMWPQRFSAIKCGLAHFMGPSNREEMLGANSVKLDTSQPFKL